MGQDIIIQKVEKEKTLIEVHRNTALNLKKLAITPRESYDEIINRVLYDVNDFKKINQLKGYKINKLRRKK